MTPLTLSDYGHLIGNDANYVHWSNAVLRKI
jgi:hypothetical protein